MTLTKQSEAQRNQGFDLLLAWTITHWILGGLRVVSVAKGVRILSAIAPELAGGRMTGHQVWQAL
ncbi:MULTISPECIES: hypothetical protein [unclassified Pseudomonas]|uniref:hypothetical protein n=1 Tax=unclassified Pseudomonas TaxID=196821 RepID=UPI000B88B999|nr:MULTISPECIES: hypothetical protein [unclassified Pseudomonas]